MGTLLPPNLPLYLYRYRSVRPREDNAGKLKPTVDRELAAVTQPYIWCSDFDKLNDPMEGFYRPSSILKDRSNYADILRRIRHNKIKVGIASFSDTKENELMWTHYADNYAGICIEYYARRLLDSLPDDIDLIRMGYDDSPPRISSKDTRNIDKAVRKIFSQKKFNWAYEREWRILGPVGRVELDSLNLVRSVYLGSRISASHKDRIFHTLQGTDIRIHEMDVDGYKHGWNRINPPVKKKRRRRTA